MLSFFKKSSFPPSWKWTSEGVIWRFILSETGDILIENRLREQKQVFFSRLNPSDGTLVWDQVQTEEPWFSGMETAAGDFLYLHGYLDPKLPEHLGIYCIRISTGRLEWFDMKRSFFHANSQEVFAYDPASTDRRMVVLNPQSGEVMRIPEMGEAEEKRASEPEFPGFIQSVFPEKISEGSALSNDFFPWIRSLDPGFEAMGGLDYLEAGSQVVFGFHYRKNGELKYDLAFADSEKLILKNRMVLSSQLSGYAGDLFFSDRGKLIAVKERNELVGWNLKE